MFNIVSRLLLPSSRAPSAGSLRLYACASAFFRDRRMQPNDRIAWTHTRTGSERGLYFSTAEFNSTVEESLQKWCTIFTQQKISEPLESIANILASVLRTKNLADVYKYRKFVLSDLQVQDVNAMCAKRLEKMPVQYIIGEWDFRDINLKVRPPVFIPRPETEILVELALQVIKQRNVKEILELCCGSGAISCSLLHSVPHLSAVSIDISSEACHLCAENAAKLSLSKRILIEPCAVKDFTSFRKFDLIIGNPPYVLSGEMKDLQPEILLYEDAEALDGGADGLDVVKQILTLSSRFLSADGRLFLEVDPSHPRLISDLLRDAASAGGLTYVGAHKDLSGETRFVEIIKAQQGPQEAHAEMRDANVG